MNQSTPSKLKTALLINLPTFIVLFIFLALPTITRAPQLNFKKQYFESAKDLNISDVISLPANQWRDVRTRQPGTSLFSEVHSWIKIEVPAASLEDDRDLVATMSFPLHFVFNFYLVENGRVIDLGFKPGDTQNQDTSAQWLAKLYVFQQAEATQREIYVKTLSVGRLLADVGIFELSRLRHDHAIIKWLAGFTLGAEFGILIYNLFLAFRMRKVMYLYYAFFLAAVLMLLATMSGMLALVFPSLAQEYLLIAVTTAESILISLIAILMFQRSFLSVDRIDFWMFKYHSWIVASLIAFACIAPWLPLYVYPSFLTLTMLLIMIRTRIITYKFSHIASIRGYGLAMSSLVGGWIVSFLAWFEWIEADFLRIHAFQIGGLFASAYLSISISGRIRELERQRTEIINQMKRGTAGDAQSANTLAPTDRSLDTAEACVMFIDIASFSQLSASLPSSRVFSELSQRLGEMAKIVRDFGGHIDRSLGDGLLCFFGYKSNEDAKVNTLNAFQAALNIQLLSAQNASELDPNDKKMLVMPVRIGIHSAKVVLGNLGGNTRIDYTMIGSGLNFAARLEAACAPFRIAVSDVCRNYLTELGQDPDRFVAVAVNVKHVDHFITAYEFDPFRDLPDVLERAEQIHLQQLGVKTVDKRFTIRAEDMVRLQNPEAVFYVRDFSKYGFRVFSSRCFGRLATLAVKIETSSESVNQLLCDRYADELTVEVRWNRATTDGFEHGVRIVGGCDALRSFLFKQLSSNFLGRQHLDATDSREAA